MAIRINNAAKISQGISNRVSSLKSSQTRFVYEEIPLAISDGIVAPSDENTIRPVLQKFAPTIYSSYSKVSDAFWEVIDIDTNETIANQLKFNTLNDLHVWRNQNIAVENNQFSRKLIFKLYDLIDFNIPQISKIYGMNSLLSGFKGRKKYKGGSATAINMNSSWDGGYAFMKGMFDHHEPQLASIVPEDDFRLDRGKGTFWLPTNHLKYYVLPTTVSNIRFGTNINQTRTMSNQNWEGLGNFSVSQNTTYRLRDPAYFYMNSFSSQSTFEIIPNIVGDSQKNIKSSLLSPQGSGLIFYQVYDPTQSEGDKKIATYIKPLGIDVVYLNWFDRNMYDLEIVKFSTEHQNILFEKVNENQIFLDDAENSMMGVYKGAWTPNGSLRASYLSESWKTQGDVIYFRLRNKSTKIAGPLSNTFIYWKDSVGIFPGAWMVA